MDHDRAITKIKNGGLSAWERTDSSKWLKIHLCILEIFNIICQESEEIKVLIAKDVMEEFSAVRVEKPEPVQTENVSRVDRDATWDNIQMQVVGGGVLGCHQDVVQTYTHTLRPLSRVLGMTPSQRQVVGGDFRCGRRRRCWCHGSQLETPNTQGQQQCRQLTAGSLLALGDTWRLWQPHGAYNGQEIGLQVTDPPIGQISYGFQVACTHTPGVSGLHLCSNQSMSQDLNVEEDLASEPPR
ncbi:hypothetical protein LXL04_015226 [Taraxacum kok-saghyz]